MNLDTLSMRNKSIVFSKKFGKFVKRVTYARSDKGFIALLKIVYIIRSFEGLGQIIWIHGAMVEDAPKY